MGDSAASEVLITALPLDLANINCFWMMKALHQSRELLSVGGYCMAGTWGRWVSILLLPTTGELLEESQMEASKLRQKAEDLVKDNKMLIASSLEDLVETGGRRHKAYRGGVTCWLRVLGAGEAKGCEEGCHDWGRNHPWGVCCLHSCTRQGEALLSRRLMAASSPLSAAIVPDPSSTQAVPGSAQLDVEARKSSPNVSVVNVRAGMARGKSSI